MSALALGRMIGRVPRQWGNGSLMLSPVIHEQQRDNGAHAHQAAFVTMMLHGEYAETAARRAIRYERFTTIYHPAALEHDDRVGQPGVRLLIFELDPALLDDVRFDRDAMSSVRDLSATESAWDLLALYRSADDDPFAFEASALKLAGDLAKIRTRIPRDLPSLVRTRDYVHAHFRTRMTMRDIACAAGIHPVYLGQMFHRETGETIAAYVNRLRVRAAADALCESDAPLATIALEHGFCDQSHFQRVFRNVAGWTPAAFRACFSPSPATARL